MNSTARSTPALTLFDSVPDDYLRFGMGDRFNAKEVQGFLGLKKEDISRLAGVSPKSVRFDDAMPEPVRERLEELALTINLVARVFGGDVDKTTAWFKVRNPLLADQAPRDMVRAGRFEELRHFILEAMVSPKPLAEKAPAPKLDPVTESAVRRFMGLIASTYHPKQIIVFGSRARGTHRPDSDADVAVLLEGEHQPFLTTKLKLADTAYDVLLDTGVNISPLPIWEDEWAHPEQHSNPALLANIVREGVRLS